MNIKFYHLTYDYYTSITVATEPSTKTNPLNTINDTITQNWHTQTHTKFTKLRKPDDIAKNYSSSSDETKPKQQNEKSPNGTAQKLSYCTNDQHRIIREHRTVTERFTFNSWGIASGRGKKRTRPSPVADGFWLDLVSQRLPVVPHFRFAYRNNSTYELKTVMTNSNGWVSFVDFFLYDLVWLRKKIIKVKWFDCEMLEVER